MEIGSDSWCTAMSEVLADVDLPEVRATVEQRIGDGNGGPVVAYRLVIDGGRAHLEPVPADAEPTGSEPGDVGDRAGERGGQGGGEAGQAGDSEGVGTGDDGGPGVGVGNDGGVVVMSQSRETAEAVRRGEMGALAALQAGLITVSGDVRVLIAASEALALVNTALGQALTDGEGSASSGGAGETDGADGGGTGSAGDAAEDGSGGG